MIIRPDTDGTYSDRFFKLVLKGLSEELDGAFPIIDYQVKSSRSVHEIETAIAQNNPKLLILMDMKAINLYKRYQLQNPDRDFPPAVMVMSLFIEREINSMKNVVGIEYQVQGITSLVNLRFLMLRPIKRVGVVYRKEIEGFYQAQVAKCREEDIELVGLLLDPKGRGLKPSHVKKALNKLVRRQKVDAIWVLNDSVIWSPAYLAQAWIPALANKDIPIVVGIHKFVENDEFIGHYAVVPDHYALGQQAAELVFNIQEDNWEINFNPVQSPISVRKILNRRKLTKALNADINHHILLELDKIIE